MDNATSTAAADIITSLEAARGKPFGGKRRAILTAAIELGVDDATLAALAAALLVETGPTIVLPAHHYEVLSRGKGWCGQGKGTGAVWGAREPGVYGGAYRVGPGRWVVGANDGFSRKGQDTWDVRHVQARGQTWTVAS